MISNKKVATAILTMIACIWLCGVMEARGVRKVVVRSAYNEYISNNLSSAYRYPSSSYIYYDINNDGVEELIFRFAFRGMQNGYKVFTYKKGTVYETIPEMRAVYCVYYNKKKKRICFYDSTGAIMNRYTEYRLKGTVLRKVTSFYISDEYEDGRFFKDTRYITENKYNNSVRKYQKWKRF